MWSSQHVKTLHAQACTQARFQAQTLVMYVATTKGNLTSRKAEGLYAL